MPESQVIGIASLLTLTRAMAGTANVIGSIMADGKVDYKDVSDVPAALSNLKSYTDVDFSQVLPEINDLSGEESDALAEEFRKSFHINDQSKEATIEQGFSVLLQGYQAALLFIEIAKKIKGQFGDKPESQDEASPTLPQSSI